MFYIDKYTFLEYLSFHSLSLIPIHIETNQVMLYHQTSGVNIEFPFSERTATTDTIDT